jgi:hypothetical protein
VTAAAAAPLLLAAEMPQAQRPLLQLRRWSLQKALQVQLSWKTSPWRARTRRAGRLAKSQGSLPDHRWGARLLVSLASLQRR